MIDLSVALTPAIVAFCAGAFIAAYLIGSIPFAYIIVKLVTGEDVTTHGTGNVGAMNVRRTTDSWWWFSVAVVADALKGIVPVVASAAALAFYAGMSNGMSSQAVTVWVASSLGSLWRLDPLAGVAMIGAVVGHNWSLWMSLIEHRVMASGKGLATGGGALLVYDWRLLVVGLVVGLGMIALTRYSMAGQVAGTLAVPVYALAMRQPDLPYITVVAAVVYARHHKRFVGMLRGEEPKVYIHDRMGPRG